MVTGHQASRYFLPDTSIAALPYRSKTNSLFDLFPLPLRWSPPSYFPLYLSFTLSLYLFVIFSSLYLPHSLLHNCSLSPFPLFPSPPLPFIVTSFPHLCPFLSPSSLFPLFLSSLPFFLLPLFSFPRHPHHLRHAPEPRTNPHTKKGKEKRKTKKKILVKMTLDFHLSLRET